jgi:uncharacterized glyoxalase superfamily protein PhnB
MGPTSRTRLLAAGSRGPANGRRGVPGADALHDEFVARGVTVVQPLEDQPYGMRDFSVESPEGHRLLFGSPRT